MATDIQPFKIAVPDDAIDQLKSKLAIASFAHEVEFSNDWAYGTPMNDIARLVHRWQTKFDWRKQETALNSLPQFTTTIEIEGFGSLNIHFLHQRSTDPKSIPLLFVHGCESLSNNGGKGKSEHRMYV